MRPFSVFGRYVLFIREQLVRRESFRTYYSLFIDECVKMGYNSIVIVAASATFMGIVTTIQTAYNLDSPLLPHWLVAVVMRDMTILGLAPTVISFILAGKLGSLISTEIGTMRISEQIDALEVLGINAVSHLVLPKILASILMFPLLVVLACFSSILGGYLIAITLDIVSGTDFVYGLRSQFNPFSVTYSIIKSVVFGYLVASIAAFNGYYIKGGAKEVGEASTSAVTNCCVAIMIADYALTQILLH